MLMNISSLLGAQGASFRDVMSAVTYLKRPRDGARLRAVFRDHGFDGFPTTLVAAPLCRPTSCVKPKSLRLCRYRTPRHSEAQWRGRSSGDETIARGRGMSS